MPTDPVDLTGTTEGLAASLGQLDSLSNAFGASLTAAFKGAVVQGKALDTVLRGIAERLASKALDAALNPLALALTGGATGWLSGLIGFSHGGVLSGGRVVPFAAGGVVSAPSYFPIAGGGTGLMGEAGAEAIMPLARGADGRLGVAVSGANAAPTQIVFNVTTPDAASFRRAEAQMTGMLARAVGRGRRGL